KVEQTLLDRFPGHAVAGRVENDVIDPARKTREHRALRRKNVAKSGERDIRAGRDIRNRDVLPGALSGELHERVDDRVSRILGRRRYARLGLGSSSGVAVQMFVSHLGLPRYHEILT